MREKASLYCQCTELKSGWLPALNDASVELTKEEHLQRSKGSAELRFDFCIPSVYFACQKEEMMER